MRRGAIFVLLLVFAVPGVHAQEIARNNELLAADGTLIPDFERAIPTVEADPLEDQAVTPATPALEPQDPLNQSYAGSTAHVIDQRDSERLTNGLPDPLNQAPRNFREGTYLQGERGVGRVSTDKNWRRRDETAFDPLGIRAGGFVFYPELYSRLITSNNIFATSDKQKSDTALEITPTFRLRSDWNVHALAFFVTGTQKNWRTFSSENTTEYEAKIRGRVDITARTSVEAGARYELATEGRGSVELTDAAVGPGKTHETELFGQFNHRFNRLGFRLRGQVVRHLYDDVSLKGGGVQDNHFRNFDEQTLNLRTNYEFSPRFSLYADTQIGQRVFANKLDANGVLQGSDSWLGAIGARVELTPSLRFLGHVGYARATPNEPDFVNLEGVVYDANLIWSPFRFTTLSLKGQTELEETTQAGSPGSLNRSVGVEVSQEWTHRLSTKMSAEYEVRDYAGIVEKDNEFSFGLVAEYMLNRSWVVDAGYEQTRTKATNSYRENEVHLGVKWRR